MATHETLFQRLDYMTYEAARLGEKPQFGGDPENDMTPANQHDLGVVLQMVASLADIVRDALTIEARTADTAARTAQRQSALENGLDPDV